MIRKSIIVKWFFVLPICCLLTVGFGQGIVLAGNHYVDALLGTDDLSYAGSSGSMEWKTITHSLNQAVLLPLILRQ